MCDLMVQMEGVSPNSSLCQKVPFVLKEVRMMFSVVSLLPMSSNFGDYIAFHFKDVLLI